MAVSLYHQGDNLDRERIRALTGQPEPAKPPSRPPLDEWLRIWIDSDADPREFMDSFPGVMWHLADAWARRTAPNIVLVHYADLSNDLEGEVRRIARRLGIQVPAATWPQLVHAAEFEQMRNRADELAPDAAGILKDPARFFRRGKSGSGRELLSSDELGHYEARAAALAPPISWRGSTGSVGP